LILAVALAGCGILKEDEHKDWTAEQFYKAAKEQLDQHNWESASKLYEQLESRYPYGRFAQQAQIEIAYSYYKQGETAQSVSAAEKFSKLHRNSPNVACALYIKALANFKEDMGTRGKGIKQALAERAPKAARESLEGSKERVTRSPDSRYAEDSKLRMAYLVEALARH